MAFIDVFAWIVFVILIAIVAAVFVAIGMNALRPQAQTHTPISASKPLPVAKPGSPLS